MLEKLGYTDIVYVAGSDRVEQFEKLFNDYNGKEYNFNSIQVVSAGERDPDADGAEGMSASKMRAAAASGDFDSFAQGVPTPALAQKLYDAVRTGMGIKDTVSTEAERGFRGVGGARGRENDENEKIDAMLAKQDQQRRDYEQSGKFWLKTKDTQQHISDEFVGKAAANKAALELLKQKPELKGNLLITAYGPDEKQEGVAEGYTINENSDVLAGLTDILKIAASKQTPQNPQYFARQVKDISLQLKDNPATQKMSNYLDSVVRWADVISSGKEKYSLEFANEVYNVLGPATRAYQDALLNKQGVAEVSKATIDRYVAKASDAHGDADFKARMSKNDPDKRSYHVDQKKTAEKRRQGISRALDRMSKEGVAEGAPIVVAQAPIDIRNPKKAPQPYRNQGDIVPDTKPPSTEKRGVKGRPGQRPMPKYDEASYEGNIGIMELFKFFSKAEKEDPKLVARVKEMIKQRRDKEVWRIIQDYTGTQLTGKEFEGSIKEAIFREAGHGKYWCSTDKKWKYRQGPKQSRSS
jgi:hypothetical protein